ncbi:hypothetical protein ACR78Z_18030 [Sphingobacterium thalpophilum]|uniref:hypothetical protein n=1 Tax=Sphingobacterium thalpophilum TaxID=259 RepID=UPI003DA4F6AD
MIKFKNILFMASLCYAADSSAQSFQQGDNTINLSVGIGGSLGIPIGVSYEHAVHEQISVGVYGGYSGKKESLGDYGNWKYSHILLAGKSSYHLKVHSKFDPYAGLMLGYNIASVKWDGADEVPVSASSGGFFWALHIGSKYWFNTKVGAFAEVGYGLGVLNVGMAFKLK